METQTNKANKWQQLFAILFATILIGAITVFSAFSNIKKKNAEHEKENISIYENLILDLSQDFQLLRLQNHTLAHEFTDDVSLIAETNLATVNETINHIQETANIKTSIGILMRVNTKELEEFNYLLSGFYPDLALHQLITKDRSPENIWHYPVVGIEHNSPYQALIGYDFSSDKHLRQLIDNLFASKHEDMVSTTDHAISKMFNTPFMLIVSKSANKKYAAFSLIDLNKMLQQDKFKPYEIFLSEPTKAGSFNVFYSNLPEASNTPAINNNGCLQKTMRVINKELLLTVCNRKEPAFLQIILLHTFIGSLIFLIVYYYLMMVFRYQHIIQTRVEEQTRELLVAKEASEAANDSKTDFLQRMSHELRTPLNAILGFAQLQHIRMPDDAPASAKKTNQKILDAGKHLLSIIDDILDIIDSENNALAIKPETQDITRVIKDALLSVQDQATEKNIQLINQSESFHLPVDAKRLKQILVNLLSNAINYNNANGEVCIRTESRDQHLLIHIEDSGWGIEPQLEKHLFEPFKRGKFAEEQGIRGTGIGLTVSMYLVRAMHGDIRFENRGEAGSCFTVILPQKIEL